MLDLNILNTYSSVNQVVLIEAGSPMQAGGYDSIVLTEAAEEIRYHIVSLRTIISQAASRVGGQQECVSAGETQTDSHVFHH